MISIYLDADGRVIGFCPDDLTGTTGWTWVNWTPPGDLTDAGGMALYKWDGAHVVARTAEEVAGDEVDAEPEQSSDLTIDDVTEILGEQEFYICLLELGVSIDDL